MKGRFTLLGASAFTAYALIAGAASAQTASSAAAAETAEPEDIVITGSRIRRADVVGVGPATVVGAAEIENTGITNVETILQRLPANAGYAGNQTSAYWASNGWGTATVNLRGLGQKRTLVLLNNRRLVAGGTGANTSPDLNMIPTAAIERIDVLKDGASAIYGADAVAGVVNIITRKNFEGLQVGGRFGITDEGDGEEYNADLLWGLRGDRGGVTAAVSYQKTSAINMADRVPCLLGESGGKLVCTGSAATIGGRAVLPNGSQINFNQTPGGNGNFFEPYSAAKHNFNSTPYLNAVSPVERVSTAFLGDYEVTDNVTAFGEFLYTFRKTNQIAAPGVLRNLRISAANPTNPTGQDITLVQRRLLEPGPRQFFQETNTWQLAGGVRGELSNGWAWEVAGNYGRNTGIDGGTNIANLERVGNTLNTSVCSTAANAAIPCADYLGHGDLTPRVLDYILFTMRDTGGNELASVTADLTGDLFQLPAGPLAFATGVVWRTEKGWRNPDPLTVLGVANTNQQDPISGTSKAKEAYLELSAPMVEDLPFAKALTLNGAVRYSDYDLFGGDWNYKLGLDWEVVGGLRVRSTYGTGFRIPSVPELFGGVSEGNLTTTDPCSRYSQSTNATLRANCQATGVPANYVQLGNTILTTVGGNINLKPESAETWTVGAVWQPTFVRGLTLTVDYFDITIKDAIRSIPGSTKLAVCYNSANLSHPFCAPGNFTRSPLTGEVTYLSAQPINTGRETMAGIDFGAIYNREIGGIDTSLNLNVTYLDDYTIYPFPGGDPIVFDGFIGGGNGGYPHWRGYGSISGTKGAFTGTYSVQWIGKATDFNAAPTAIGYRAPNVTYHNLQLAYDVNDRARLSFGVDNLFDKKAPFIQSYTDANTDTMTYDLTGRRFYVSARYLFN